MRNRIVVLLVLCLAVLVLASCEEPGYTYIDYTIPEMFHGDWMSSVGDYYRITDSTIDYKYKTDSTWTPILTGHNVTDTMWETIGAVYDYTFFYTHWTEDGYFLETCISLRKYKSGGGSMIDISGVPYYRTAL